MVVMKEYNISDAGELIWTFAVLFFSKQMNQRIWGQDCVYLFHKINCKKANKPQSSCQKEKTIK